MYRTIKLKNQAEKGQFSEKFGVLAKEGKTIILDTETTGLESGDEILQLAIVDGEGKTLFNEYFRPEHTQTWPEAEAVNGIRPADVVDKPPLSVHRKQIQRIIDDTDIIVIYNAEFDLGMLRRQGIRIPREAVIVDMMILFAEIYGEWNDYYGNYKWQKLTKCADYYSYDWGTDEAHDALADCRATLYCMHKMRDAVQL